MPLEQLLGFVTIQGHEELATVCSSAGSFQWVPAPNRGRQPSAKLSPRVLP